jgi:hypothetical protein
MKYFDEEDLLQLLKYDPTEKECKTLNLINEKHPFSLDIETPSLLNHLHYLNSELKDYVQGVTNHQSMFSREEELSEAAIEDQETLIGERFKELN